MCLGVQRLSLYVLSIFTDSVLVPLLLQAIALKFVVKLIANATKAIFGLNVFHGTISIHCWMSPQQTNCNKNEKKYIYKWF